MRIENPAARGFYEIEAARENWASRELERQVASLLFERLARSRDKDKVLALAKKGHEVVVPGEVNELPDQPIDHFFICVRRHGRQRPAEGANGRVQKPCYENAGILSFEKIEPLCALRQAFLQIV
ncbi:MAG: hypothetical protein LAP85_23440 [Acidobacteriia bacterium]|nr:hypothetical protein [Terriglobia bacterium]